MKDEEMAEKHAEEYVMREDVITENDRVPFDNGYGFQTVSFEDEVKKGYKDGFLAGLKAGRPQWHDLQKDKKDLPKFRRNILVTCEYRSKLKKKRETFEWDYNSEMPLYAIAWCEIPTFDKE